MVSFSSLYLLPGKTRGMGAVGLALVFCCMAAGQQTAAPPQTRKPALNAAPTAPAIVPGSATQSVPGAALQQPSTTLGNAHTWQPTNSGTSALPVVPPVQRPAASSSSSQPNADATEDQDAPPASSDNRAAPAPTLQQPSQPAASAASPYIHSVLNAPTTGRSAVHGTDIKLILPKQTLYRQPHPIRFDNSRREMTTEGYLVIDVPKGWKRSSGPGLLYCLPDRGLLKASDASMYVGSAQIDPKSKDREAVSFKSASSFIQSDIRGFKSQFPNGNITEDNALELPLTSARYYVYAFQSGSKHNAFEEVVYVDEGTEVLAITLSAGSYKAFRNQLPAFYKFAKSYQGTIPFTANQNMQ